MKKLLLSTLFALLMSPMAMAQNAIKPLDETGIYLDGDCKAIASSPDGYTYVLMFDKRLIRIDCDGTQKEIPIPLNKEVNNLNDYFCDMAVDSRAVYFCGYDVSAIVALDLKNPKELKTLPLSYENKPIRPMMISRTKDGWTIKDFDYRTFKVDIKGNLTLLPNLSEVVLDKNGKPVIKVDPYHEDDKIVFPGKLVDENNNTKWIAPKPEEPMVVLSLNYLGYDSDNDRDVYIANYSSGDMVAEMNVFAVDSSNNIVAHRLIPPTSLAFIMSYCKLAYDGSIIAVYCDPQNPDTRVILKRYELNSDSADQKG